MRKINKAQVNQNEYGMGTDLANLYDPVPSGKSPKQAYSQVLNQLHCSRPAKVPLLFDRCV
jgi:hypothetical protein